MADVKTPNEARITGRGRAGQRAGGARLLRVWLLGACMVCGSLPAAGGQARPPRQAPGEGSLTWELTAPKVLKPGRTSTNAAGIILTGCIIEADARGTNNGRLSDGLFHLALNAFCPRTNQSNLVAGRWQVRGTWVLADKPPGENQDPAGTVRPHLDYLQGYLLAELGASPADPLSPFSASAWASETRPLGPQNKYEGSFQGKGQFEGRLSLKLTQTDPPSAKAGAGQPETQTNSISDWSLCH